MYAGFLLAVGSISADDLKVAPTTFSLENEQPNVPIKQLEKDDVLVE